MKSVSYKGLAPASAAASKSKKSNKARNSKPELLLRRALWAKGLRYWINVRSIAGCPDIVFWKPRIAVFCDGDFWHGRHWDTKRDALSNGHNGKYWIAKIEANMHRDLRTTAELAASGWKVIRIWEGDIICCLDQQTDKVIRAVQTSKIEKCNLKDKLCVS